MKNMISVLCFILFACSIKSYSQSRKDSISIEKHFFGTKFYFDGDALPARGLFDLTKDIPAAVPEINLAKKNHTISSALRITGCVLIVASLEQFFQFSTTASPHVALVASGAGLILTSFAFSKAFGTHAKNAATMYNSSAKKMSFGNQPVQLKFDCSLNHVRLKVLF